MNTNCNVLITGATNGIGYELSRRYALHGYNLIMVARNKKKLDECKDFFSGYPINVITIAMDLTHKNAAKKLIGILNEKKCRVDILVNNAGFGAYGFFAKTQIEKELSMIQLHTVFLTEFTKYILPQMIRRRHGKILNVASTAAYIPCPLAAVYASTKAYILSFSRALRMELKKTGVNVSILCPGPTHTSFADNAKMNNTRLYNYMVSSAEMVGQAAYKYLNRNKRIIIPGIVNKMEVFLSKIVPFQLTDTISQWMLRTDTTK